MGITGRIKNIIKGNSYKALKEYPFRMAWLSDIHAGAQYAIATRNITLPGGIVARGNWAQQTMMDYFEAFAKEAKDNDITHLMIVGDLIAGQNRKDANRFLITTDLPTQIQIATDLICKFLRMVPTIQEVYIWKGTDYHEIYGLPAGEYIATKVQEKMKISTKYMGNYSWIELQYKDHSKKLFISHHASGGTVYPESAIARDLQGFLKAWGAERLPIKPDIIVRAHNHSFIGIHEHNIRAIQLPCWQFFVPYDNAMKRYPYWQPDIGGVITLFDHKLRTTAWPFTYPNIIDPQSYLKLTKIYGVTGKRLGKK